MSEIQDYILGFKSGHDHRYYVENTGHYENIVSKLRSLMDDVHGLLTDVE